jgi:hypothetical protein
MAGTNQFDLHVMNYHGLLERRYRRRSSSWLLGGARTDLHTKLNAKLYRIDKTELAPGFADYVPIYASQWEFRI